MPTLRSTITLTLTLALVLIFSRQGLAKPPHALDAAASDPQMLQWMVGAPPPPEKLIMQPQSNYFSFPKLRWTVCHIRELLPTQQVSRGLGAPIPLPYALDDKIDMITFTPSGATQPMTWRASLAANYTDGVLILHQGKVVYEKYFGCLNEQGQHAAMSMTKSLTGLLAEILIAEGKLNENAKVASLVPELKGSAFGSATVRQVMDMTTSLRYSEDYADPKADIWAYSAAASPLPKAPDYQGPNGYFEYLQTVQAAGPHGQAFGYKTVNTDALGWIIARVSGTNLTQLLSQKIWQKMGAEQDAYMTVDGKGTPFAGGGLSAGLRDLARLGQLVLNKGSLNGVQVFPKSVVESLQRGGDKQAFKQAGYSSLSGGSYRSMWWILHNSHQAFAARGVHGQTIYIDPTAQMVIVRLASFPSAKNAQIDPTSLPAYQAVADYLAAKTQ
ncbi:MAG: serine hydrolase [Gammaproteobacteria bacterium]|nr:serine hydrolase [Gammaproteobacteria bacterium]